MIQANELRVGNFVFHKEYHNDWNEIRSVSKDRVHPIELIEHNDNTIYAHQCTLADLHPIPLTPELLEKCGFVKLNNAYIIDNGSRNEHGDIISGDTTFTLFDHSFGECSNLKYVSTPITSLHQLQNLYFALTGTELTITL